MISLLIFCFSLVSFSSAQLCKGNQFNYFDSCLDTCPQNTIPQLIFGASRCIQCDITKFKRLNSDATSCQCAIQAFQLKNSDQCVPCHYSCITCNGTSNVDCLTCDTPNPTTFRVKKGNTCLCLEGYFESELLSTTCLKCHSSCQTCLGSTESDCLSCAQGRIKDQIGDCVCSNGFVMNEQGQCSCPFPVSSDNVCRNQVTQCGFGQVPDVGKTIANVGRRGGAISCVCQPGLYRIRGSCGSCGSNEVYNQKKRKCQCQKGAQKFDGRCILCPSNQIFNKKTGECNCKKNEQLTQKGTCIRCPPKSVYQNGQCSCVFNYYSGPSGACRRCSKKANHPSCMEQVHGIDRQRKLTVDQVIKKSNRS